MELKEICAKYVAFLRTLYLLHQNHHWLTFGVGFYGNHLLFERLYKSAQENADMAAEKFIGLFGREVLGVKEQSNLIKELLDKYSTTEYYSKHSLKAEQDFLEFSTSIYEKLKSQNKMSLGLDDMIMSIAGNREESVYLLKQNLGDDMSKLSMLAKKFQIKLAQNAIPDRASQLKQKISDTLNVNLANRNWGQVGFNSLSVVDKGDRMVVSYNLIIPTNSPPFVDKNKYPQGLNQFKQEMMKLVSDIADNLGVGNLVQIININEQTKVAQVANQSVPVMPDPNAGPKSSAEAQARMDAVKLQEVGESIKADLIETLALKNAQPNDLKFTKLRYVDSNGQKSIEWAMSISPNMVQQFQAGVANQRKGNPNFAVPKYVGQLFNQKLPGAPVLPAQPLTIG